MARSRTTDQALDDIELLNIHRYPDSVPPATLAYVRNSRACQKRLEELLKSTPLKKASGRANIEKLLPEGQGDQEQRSRPAPAEKSGRKKNFFQKLFS